MLWQLPRKDILSHLKLSQEGGNQDSAYCFFVNRVWHHIVHRDASAMLVYMHMGIREYNHNSLFTPQSSLLHSHPQELPFPYPIPSLQ